MTECMIAVFTDVMKCRAASMNQFRRQLTQMKDHNIVGKQQRIVDQSSHNEEREVYAGSPLAKLRIQVDCIQVAYTYTHTFTEGKAHISWKTKILVRIIFSMVF